MYIQVFKLTSYMFVLYILKTIFVSGLILFRSIEIVSLSSFPLAVPLRHSSPFESIGNSDKSPGMKVDLVVFVLFNSRSATTIPANGAAVSGPALGVGAHSSNL